MRYPVKQLAAILLAGVALILSGCNGSDDDEKKKKDPVPDAPTTPSAQSPISGTAIVTWTPSTGATSHTIYFSNTSGVTKTTGTPIPATTPYTHSSLTDGLTYYYIVTASNATGESADSWEAATLPLPPPAATNRGDGVSPAATIASSGSPPGSEARTSAHDAGRS